MAEKYNGWQCVQEEAMGIINPLSCTVITKPDSMSSEYFLFLLKCWSHNPDIKLTTENTIVVNNEEGEDFLKFFGTLKGHYLNSSVIGQI